MRYIVDSQGNILTKYEGEKIVFGGPWQYATEIESTIKDGVAVVKDGKVTINKKSE